MAVCVVYRSHSDPACKCVRRFEDAIVLDWFRNHWRQLAHVAQLCLHTDCSEGVDLYHRWIFFDDLWAAAQPDLANSILRYDRCWDVLSPDGPHDEG